MVSIKRFEQKSAIVNSIVEDIVHALPDNEIAEELENNFGELYSMILGLCETLGVLNSDIEK
ncbi:hypothetical protein FDC50_10265 [Clostridium botulinum]|nr:hypothetical protein KU41_17335 [Clostridium botulinum]MBY6804327.1 hypothetical protein [Clostridium botulinum]MBY6813290.1 hypothetical protein [Clostridium botulinum]MBY6821976.1 hypothetical protein [Clostridium botulinum]NFJ49902.1 hypothetical protein [Clostridium botulinum]